MSFLRLGLTAAAAASTRTTVGAGSRARGESSAGTEAAATRCWREGKAKAKVCSAAEETLELDAGCLVGEGGALLSGYARGGG